MNEQPTANQLQETKKKMMFPIGAVLFLLSHFSSIVSIISSFGSSMKVSFGSIISILSIIAFSVILLMKKRSIVAAVPLVILAAISLLNLSGPISIILSNISTMLICSTLALLVLSCDNNPLKALKSKEKLLSIILYAALALSVLCSILYWAKSGLNYYFIPYNFGSINVQWPVANDAIFCTAIILIKKWIADPYKKEKVKKVSRSSDGADTADSSEHYISLTKHILLLIFTFGVWQYIWVYKTTGYTNLAADEDERTPVRELLLCLFVPVYIIIWTYKTALRVDKIAKANDVQSDLGTLCLILSIIFGIIPPILMQDKINSIASK